MYVCSLDFGSRIEKCVLNLIFHIFNLGIENF